MNTISTILIIVDILIAILLTALVLVQQSKKGGGLGTTFGGGGSDTLFGAHASTQLSKLTAVFATVFAIITLVLTIISGSMTKKGNSELDSLLKPKPVASAQGFPKSSTSATAEQKSNTLEKNKIPLKTKSDSLNKEHTSKKQ